MERKTHAVPQPKAAHSNQNVDARRDGADGENPATLGAVDQNVGNLQDIVKAVNRAEGLADVNVSPRQFQRDRLSFFLLVESNQRIMGGVSDMRVKAANDNLLNQLLINT